MIRTFIIEDEPRACRNLIRLLEENFPEMETVGTAGSVRDSVQWLREHEADVIFMDVELSDGNCFDIFAETEVKPLVVMTTAYDSYAVRAFEVNSVDYLLKPFSVTELRRAVSRVEEKLRMERETVDFSKVLEAFQALKGPSGELPRPDTAGGPRREKFIIRLNDRIVPVAARDIAYFYSEAKNTFIVTRANVSYVLDDSLDAVEDQLDPARFFRISRSCIIAADTIDSVSKLLGGRLRISPVRGVESFTDLTVSRARVVAFLDWLEK